MVESLGLGVSGVGNESDGDGVGIDFRMFKLVRCQDRLGFLGACGKHSYFSWSLVSHGIEFSFDGDVKSYLIW